MHALPPNFLLSLSPARTRDLTHALSATATRPERRAFIAGGSGGDQGDGHTPPPPPPATTWERRRRACKNTRRGGSRVGKASGPTPALTPSPPSITITPCLTVRLGVRKVGEVVTPPPRTPRSPRLPPGSIGSTDEPRALPSESKGIYVLAYLHRQNACVRSLPRSYTQPACGHGARRIRTDVGGAAHQALAP